MVLLLETYTLQVTGACCSAGLPFDRQWMVVRESTGKFVTQRQIPKLCKVGPPALLWLFVMATHPRPRH